MNLRFSRQIDIIDPNLLSMPIIIVGCGAIGSWATLALAKMGCSDITIIDNDTVEEANIGAQIYGENDIGKSKVEALEAIVKRSSGVEVKTYKSLGEDILAEIPKLILILALDSLEARKKCLMANTKNTPAVIIDVRMKAEVISAYCVFDEKSGLNFRKSFNPKVKVDKGKCSEKAVIYNTFFCGGLIANLVKKIANKEKLPQSVMLDLKELKIY